MKTCLGLLTLMLLTGLSFGADVNREYLRITGLSRDGQLVWTNCTCLTMPVYEVLWANSPTGGWQHVSWLTNASSFSVPALREGNDFYRISWPRDEFMQFDYTLYPGTNGPCESTNIIGRLNLLFSTNGITGSWYFEPGWDYFDEFYHPLGWGEICMGGVGDWKHPTNCGVSIMLECMADNGIHLHGSLQTTTNSAGCLVTEITGVAWENNWSCGYDVGWFVARRTAWP